MKGTRTTGRGKKIKRIKYLIVARHGERLDKAFPTLLQVRRYQRSDVNQPKEMPVPGRKFSAYRLDPPLTVFGVDLMSHVRDSLEEAGLVPAYCSPSLRCVQTGSKLAPLLKLKVEPGLQENWPAGVDLNGKFLTPTEYHRAGFKVALGYHPMKEKIFVNTQNSTAFNERFGETLDSIVKIEDKLHPGGPLPVVLTTEYNEVDRRRPSDPAIQNEWGLAFGAISHMAPQSLRHGVYTGHYEEEPKYGHITVLKRSANGGWEVKENAVKPFSTSTFTTHNELRAPEEEEDDEEEESTGSTDSD